MLHKLMVRAAQIPLGLDFSSPGSFNTLSPVAVSAPSLSAACVPATFGNPSLLGAETLSVEASR